MHSSPSSPVELICPVCQAAQPAADTCRRCRADLLGVISTRRNIALAALSIVVHTITDDRPQAAAAHHQLRWLDPKLAQQLARLQI